MKTKIELSKEDLVSLIGKRKAAKAFPDLFKVEEAMHPITDDDIFMLLSVARGEQSPAKKYEDRCLVLNPAYHWSIIKRQVNGTFTSFLVPIDKNTSKQNPLRKQKTAIAGPKVAAKRKRRRKSNKTVKTA